ncbi:MAG: hypothetical protein KDD66_01610 [Bdellovibrionales bacterium]|nr:hypothetical protein [Bdellovibrionales bacterium]
MKTEQTPAIPAILLGEGLSVLGAGRSLFRAGVTAYQLSGASGIEAGSRCLKRLELTPAAKNEESLLELLERVPFDKAVLLPCSDRWVNEVAALPPELRARFPASSPGSEIVQVFTDKSGFSRLLAQHDIPHPETRIVSTLADVEQISATDCERFFMKPNDSQSFFARFGKKAFDFESGAQAKKLLQECVENNLGMILQEYVPGPPSNHYYVEGLVDRKGSIRAVFARQRLRIYPARFGNSTAMISVPSSQVQGAVDSMRKLLGAVSYRGIFSAEFKLDARDGVFRLIEVNIRLWWFNEFVASCGVNTAYMAYLDALEQEVPEVRSYRTGVREAYPYYDIHSCQVKENKTNLPSVVLSWLLSRWSVFSWSDPMPSLNWVAQRIKAKLGFSS